MGWQKEPGRSPDGGGLYLDVTNDGRRRWVWLYRLGARRREMVFAPLADMTLAEARAERDKWRALAREGRDPIDARRAERARAAVKAVATFGAVADDYIEAHRASWKNAKHATNWTNAIRSHAARLRPRPVDQVGTEDVLAVLKPIRAEIPDPASRLRDANPALPDQPNRFDLELPTECPPRHNPPPAS